MNRLMCLGLATFVGSSAMAQTFCNQMAPPPTPLPTPMSPSNAFSVEEYAFCHSSTNLQANPAYEKFAAGLFWNPPGTFGTGVVRAFGAFSSAVIVNNTSNILGTVVNIEYYDPAGVLLATTGPHFISPEGSHFEDASPIGLGVGVGSARIVVVDPEHDAPIVGATLHYFDSIFTPGNGHGVATDPDAITPPVGPPQPGPGEGSYQQIQPAPGVNRDGWLYAGPFRITNSAPTDFENGSSPLFCISNPYPTPVNAAIILFAIDQAAGFVPISTDVVTLQAFGSRFDPSMWIAVNNLIGNINFNYDFEIFMVAITDDGRQLIGDSLVVDVYGDNAGLRNLDFGKRLRMASFMMANNPSGMLEAFEVGTFTPPGGTAPMIASTTHVSNVAFTPTGPLQIQYFNHAGIQVGVDNVPGLAPAQSLHIGFGQPDSPNFPANTWNGWLRVIGNCPGDSLVGWTHREIGPTPPSWPAHYQYRKAYGEECVGPNATEPGLGIYMLPDPPPFGEIDDTVYTRKIMPIVRTWSFSTPAYWPGYTTFTNIGVLQDTQDYYYRFFELDGTDRTNYFAQPLDGLASGASSLAYEDSDPFPFSQLSLLGATQGNGSGRIDRRDDQGTPPGLAFFDGINVLGDPFGEYNIGQFARRNLGPIVKPKPIDPIPVREIAE